MAQVVERFKVKDDARKQIEDYLDDNSGSTVVALTNVSEEGDEAVIVIFDDGQ